MTQLITTALPLLLLLQQENSVLGFTTVRQRQSHQLTRLNEKGKSAGEPFTFFSLFQRENPKKEDNTSSPLPEKTSVAPTATVTPPKEEKKQPVELKEELVKEVVKPKLRNKNKGHPAYIPHISPLNGLHPSKLSKLPKDAQHLIADYHNRENIDLGASLLPVHPGIVSGELDNGFSYIILPNKAPAGRFEAHLQVFSGSADELEHQQGIAHLTEHVAYMGSRKRERLFGTGSQTNAYTDFHHTVFYAACPVNAPGATNVSMMPYALDALSEVMEAKSENSRLEKERQAVLSEMTMVNTIEYRVECQILATLHRENRLAKRFPIGKEVLIKNWKQRDVLTWHRTHYRPDNVLLYIVGDVDVNDTIKVITEKFGHLDSAKSGKYLLNDAQDDAYDLAEAISENTVKATQSWHFPPAVHNFYLDENDHQTGGHINTDDVANIDDVSVGGDVQLQGPWPLDEKVNKLSEHTTINGSKVRAHIFKHELLQNFSLHLFAKRIIEPVTTLGALKRSLARRVALAALQIRLNVNSRGADPAFTFVEFNQLDSPREGCAVCSLDLTSEPHRWKEAIIKCTSEIHRLGKFGLTNSEFDRYKEAILADAAQLAAQGDTLAHGDVLNFLMEGVACGHTVMDASDSGNLIATEVALANMTLAEVNEQAAYLCKHVSVLSSDSTEEKTESSLSSGELVVIACAPKTAPAKSGDDSSDKATFDDDVCEELLIQTIQKAANEPIEPEEEILVPSSLISPEQLSEFIVNYKPEWLPAQFSDGTPSSPINPAADFQRPAILRRLNNGMKVHCANAGIERQRGALRLVAGGGRNWEVSAGKKKSSLAIGCRTMQEGGSFLEWSREQVELFCVDHLIMVEIAANEENMVMDLQFPTCEVAGLNGVECVLQVLREVMVSYNWEEDALLRAKSSFKQAYKGQLKSLEGASEEKLVSTLTQGDVRFQTVTLEDIENVKLEDAKQSVMSQLTPSNIEISMVGDFGDQFEETVDLIYKYLGSIPEDTNSKYVDDAVKVSDEGARVPVAKLGEHVHLELEDPDPRAVAYVAGKCPNKWGFIGAEDAKIQHICEIDKIDEGRRSHPFFGAACLLLITEIINRRLFSIVREQKQLTYDANFSLTNFEALKGGWFLVTVTASKANANKALRACLETLQSIVARGGVGSDNLSSAKRVVINRHEGGLQSLKGYVEALSGLQMDSIPLKGPKCLTEFHRVVEGVTVKDVQAVLNECFDFDDEKKLFTAIGETILPEGSGAVSDVDDDEQQLTRSPIIGMKRGGALMN